MIILDRDGSLVPYERAQSRHHAATHVCTRLRELVRPPRASVCWLARVGTDQPAVRRRPPLLYRP
jgi:hypothetical protein